MTSPDRFQRLMQLFEQACELPAERRETWIAARCADDAELAAELRSMLAADERPVADAGDGAQLLAAHVAATTACGGEGGGQGDAPPGGRVRREARAPREPVRVLSGEYKLIRLVGEGGMGSVYEAEQFMPRRRVAIKVIRSSFASRRLLRRFAHEAHVLGRLQHPGIAQIYEAGAGDPDQPDQAFFVMEFVDGPPLTVHAAEKGLDLKSILGLMALVGEAVAHAHQRGVIHRDLKPANILVDPRGQPKVLDFGVARVTDGDIEVSTQLTTIGQLVGTLPYMSPEQVGGDVDDVDVRTDVYAMGVILYEMLAGRQPHDLARKSIPECARIIREEMPVRLGALRRDCRGDVETIVQKAMEKDPKRRYQSATDFADDLRRCLAGEPILARQGSALYLIRKRLRRYQGAVAAAALLAIAAAGFSIYAWRQSVISDELAAAAEAASEHAQLQAQRADANARRLARELSVSRIERGRLFARTGNVAIAEELIWPEFLRDPGSRLPFLALWELYMHEPCDATWRCHDAEARSSAVDSTGEYVVSGDITGDVRLIQIPSGLKVSAAGSLGGDVRALSFAGTDSVVAGVGDGTVAILERPSLVLRARMPAHRGVIRTVAGLRDGRFLSGGEDGFVRLWTAQGEPLDELRLPDAVTVLEPAPDGSTIAVGDFAGATRFLRVGPPEAPALELTGPELPGHVSAVSTIAFAPELLVTGGVDRCVRFWRLPDGELLDTVRRPNGTVRTARVTPDGKTLVTSGWWAVELWDLASRKVTRTYSMHDGPNTMILVNRGRHTLTSHGNGLLRLWALSQDGPKRRVHMGTGATYSAYSPDGRWIVFGDASGGVALAEVDSEEQPRPLAGLDGKVGAVAFSPDGALVAAASKPESGRRGQLAVWRVEDGALLGSLDGVNAATSTALAWAPDSRRLVVCGPRHFDVVEVPSMAVVGRIEAPGEALSVAVAPDGSSFIGSTRAHAVLHCELPTAALVRQVPFETVPWSVAVSPDGRRFAAGTWHKTIAVNDLATGERVGNLEGHSALPTCVAFDPHDPTLLLSGSGDGELRLWDVESRHCLLTIPGFEGWENTSLAMGPGGDRLVASSAAGEVAEWDLRHCDWCIAGNLRHQTELRGFGSLDAPEAAPLREWAQAVRRGQRIPWLDRGTTSPVPES